MSRTDARPLEFPDHLSEERRQLLAQLAASNEHDHGDEFLGLILSGSAGRGLATERSDLDVYVVLTDGAVAARQTTRSMEVDEIPIALAELESVPAFGTQDWWYRWSFAWAPVLLDRTGGRIQAAAERQATLTRSEQSAVLIDHDRLDGWINYAYRALKSDRDGSARERRLDAAESMPWLLDVVFSLAGRVRPYHKYLPWELREHPLPDWPHTILLDLIELTLDGNPSAIRETFTRVVASCAKYDAKTESNTLQVIIDDWGDELALFQPERR